MTAEAMTGEVASGRGVEQVTERMWQENAKVVNLSSRVQAENWTARSERQGRDHPKDDWRCG